MKKQYAVVISLFLAASVFLSCSDVFAREVKVAVFQFDVHSREDLTYIRSGISSLAASRITVPGKISVIDGYLIKKEMTKKLEEYSLLKKLSIAKKLGADFFLTGKITKTGNNFSIDALLVDVLDSEQAFPVFIQSTGLDNMIPGINSFAKKVKKIIIEGPPIPEHLTSQKSSSLAENTEGAGPSVSSSDMSSGSVPGAREEQTGIKEAPLYETVEKKPGKPEEPVFIKPLAPFQSTPYFTHEIRSKPLHTLSAGDTNGDGNSELLVAGEERILVYQVTETTFKLFDEIKAEMDENIVRVDAADINGNGVDEIYASSYEGHYANSFVVEYKKGKYERVADSRKWFFRTFEQPGEGIKLIGQKTDIANPFSGTLYMFDWKNGELVTGEEFILPGSLGIYSFTEGDIDDGGSREYIVFNRGLFSSRYQMAVLSYTGRVKWRDPQKLGGSPNFIIKLLHGADMEQKENIPLRVICDDFNNDGRLEIIVARNSKKRKGVLEKLTDYNRGEVLCLSWNGSDLEAGWTSGFLNNYVTDYILADFDSDGKKELYILSVSVGGMFGKAENRITVFKQNRR